ncbi:hypothetical protein ADUPG1_013092 [Aduncisulcus paluster]|uniref:Uncharacterized protein n=1 Tax=Aduncisulcus paluster TaxID=2918883 RepID=A0ABQ5K5C3_9EUKA|nr:hypothetical protein ADUPG1_013092 [Aduncisulcus paluster]
MDVDDAKHVRDTTSSSSSPRSPRSDGFETSMTRHSIHQHDGELGHSLSSSAISLQGCSDHIVHPRPLLSSLSHTPSALSMASSLSHLDRVYRSFISLSGCGGIRAPICNGEGSVEHCVEERQRSIRIHDQNLKQNSGATSEDDQGTVTSGIEQVGVGIHDIGTSIGLDTQFFDGSSSQPLALGYSSFGVSPGPSGISSGGIQQYNPRPVIQTTHVPPPPLLSRLFISRLCTLNSSSVLRERVWEGESGRIPLPWGFIESTDEKEDEEEGKSDGDTLGRSALGYLGSGFDEEEEEEGDMYSEDDAKEHPFVSDPLLTKNGSMKKNRHKKESSELSFPFNLSMASLSHLSSTSLFSTLFSIFPFLGHHALSFRAGVVRGYRAKEGRKERREGKKEKREGKKDVKVRTDVLLEDQETKEDDVDVLCFVGSVRVGIEVEVERKRNVRGKEKEDEEQKHLSERRKKGGKEVVSDSQPQSSRVVAMTIIKKGESVFNAISAEDTRQMMGYAAEGEKEKKKKKKKRKMQQMFQKGFNFFQKLNLMKARGDDRDITSGTDKSFEKKFPNIRLGSIEVRRLPEPGSADIEGMSSVLDFENGPLLVTVNDDTPGYSQSTFREVMDVVDLSVNEGDDPLYIVVDGVIRGPYERVWVGLADEKEGVRINTIQNLEL